MVEFDNERNGCSVLCCSGAKAREGQSEMRQEADDLDFTNVC